jgi:hypothetical protein
VTGRPVLHDFFQFQPERNLAIELFWIPTGSEDGAGDTPAQAIAPTGSLHTLALGVLRGSDSAGGR